MCRGIFPPLLCALRENKIVRGMGLKAQYLYSWGGVVTDGIRAYPVTLCGLRDTTHKVGPNEDIRDLSGGDCDVTI